MTTETKVHRFLLAASATGLLALAAVLPARADYSNTVMSLNPLGYWRLNDQTPVPVDTATNLGTLGVVGNSFYGGGVEHGQAGAIAGDSDTATHLNGITGILLPYNRVAAGTEPVTNGPLSAEIWMKPDYTNIASALAMNDAYMTSSGRQGWILLQTTTSWRLVAYTGNGTVAAVNITGGSAAPGVWHHMVVVRDDTTSTWSLYQNGNLVGSQVETNAYLSAQKPEDVTGGGVCIGSYGYLMYVTGGSAPYYWPGVVDEFALYTNALSADDVMADYMNGTNAARTTPYSTQVLSRNPAVYWRLGEPTAASTAPVAANLGSWGAGANGAYYPGTATLAPGVPYPGFAGPGTACNFGFTIPYVLPAGENSYVKIPAQNTVVTNLTITCWALRSGNQQGIGVMPVSHPTAIGLTAVNMYWMNAGWYPAPTAATPGWPTPATGLGFGNSGSPSGANNDVRFFYAGGQNTGVNGIIPNPKLYCNYYTNEWAFLALVVTQTNMVLYVNQQSVTTNLVDYGLHDFSTCPMYLGKRQELWGGTGYEMDSFIGTLAEVAVFDKALTTNEIAQLYEAAQVLPFIVTQPQAPPPPVYEGLTLKMNVVVDTSISTSPVGYQWTFNGNPIPGQTTTALTVGNLTTNNSGNYAVVLTNAVGAVTSSIVAFTVQVSPPIITQQPQPATRLTGGAATFSVAAEGSLPLSYQWYFNPTNTTVTNAIAGATGASYTVTDVEAGTLGLYFVRVSNLRGSTNSDAVALTLLPVSPGYASEVVASGPVSYWRFNETSGTTAYDYMGGVYGTNVAIVFTNGPQPSSPLVPFNGLEANNGAYTFNGTTSVVYLPKPFAVNSNAYSVVAWVRADGAVTNGAIMGQASSWCLRLDPGFALLESVPSAGLNGGNLDGARVVVDGYWHQCVLVYDGAHRYLYVDGAYDNSVASKGLVTTNANLVTIGWYGSGTARWKGDLDEVAVYNRALSAAEIADLYQVATAGQAAPQIATQPVSQVAYPGQPVTFSVVAAGGAPYTYVWYHNGTVVPGATGKTLTIPSAWYSDAGTYSVTVNNTVGPAQNSDVVSLTMLVPVPTFGNLTDQLVLHLAFQNGGYADSSGRGNNASPTGSPTPTASPVGPAVHLSTAAHAYLTVSDLNGDLSFGAADSFTVAFWLRYTVGFYDLPIIGNARNSTYNAGWILTENAGRLDWTAVGGVSVIRDPAYSVGPLMNDGQWHNVVVAFDRTAAQAYSYVDSALVDTASIAGLGTLVTSSPLILGNDVTGVYGNGGFDVGDVGIWRRVLSPTEVASIYNTTNGPPVLNLVPPSASNGESLELIWQTGTLVQSTNVAGPYAPVSGATAPYYKVTPGVGNMFYRVQY
jgi:hypothetical protein